MIRTETQVPSTYSIRSRDFQLLERVFDTVFNSSKTYADTIKNCGGINKNTDKRLLDLIARTLGFESKREYDTQDLYVLCNDFKSIIKDKGTKRAIENCVRVLLNAQNLSESFTVSIDNSRYEVDVYVSKNLQDIALLEDMLEYVLPIGYYLNIFVLDNVYNVEGEVEAAVSSLVTSTNYGATSEKLGNIMDNGASATDTTVFETENSVVFGG